MSKRNIFLDAESDEEEDVVLSDVEETHDSRFLKIQAKRRRLSRSDRSSDSDEVSENEATTGADGRQHERGEDVAAGDGSLENDNESDGITVATQPGENTTSDRSSEKARRKILTKAKLEKAQQKVQKTGVIYISRIPPFMKPSTLRQLMVPYGTVLRIFLTPEPAPRYAARVKAGGNKKKSFVDGWVEFESKRRAKLCAEMLNGNIVGGKKSGFYHDDIWNIKYLRGFKWNDLMEQVSGEQREREGRLQAEIERERRERKVFLQNFERAKVERGMESKRAKKAAASKRQNGAADEFGRENDGDDDDDDPPKVEKRFEATRPRMKFKQNPVRSQAHQDATEKAIPKALSKIFG